MTYILNNTLQNIETDLIKDMYCYSELGELVTIEQIKKSTILSNLEKTKNDDLTKRDIHKFSNSNDTYR
jgi:hypothetical protein